MHPSETIVLPSIFKRRRMVDSVTLTPTEIGADDASVKAARLEAKVEGKCTHHGWIRPGSVVCDSHQPLGVIPRNALSGDVVFAMNFTADVCNPKRGDVLECVVANVTQIGVRAVVMHDTVVVVAVFLIRSDDPADLSKLKVGDRLYAAVRRTKFDRQDDCVLAWGRLVTDVNAAMTSVEDATGPLEDASDADEFDGASVLSVSHASTASPKSSVSDHPPEVADTDDAEDDEGSLGFASGEGSPEISDVDDPDVDADVKGGI